MDDSQAIDIRPVDLRGILKYVPLFRDHTFVIAVDGSIIEDDNFANILLDIAVLRSLSVNIVLVFGIGKQVEDIAAKRNVTVSDVRGDGPTDQITLEVAIQASNEQTHSLMQGFAQANLKTAITNTIRAKKCGILKGKDLGYTGTVDKLDISTINHLLSMGIIPVVPPIQFDRDGEPLRLTSDLLAADLAIGLKASKLIFLTRHSGLGVKGDVARNIPAQMLEEYIEKDPDSLEEELLPKAKYILKALNGPTSRAHIIDGRVFGALLREIFDNVGIGTMVHSNEYQQIRRAKQDDYQAIANIMQTGSKSDALMSIDPDTLSAELDDFFVYEIDGSIIGCGRLIEYPDDNIIEIASLRVQSFYNGKGVGRKMVEFAEIEAKKKGYNKIVLLTTQAVGFFQAKCGYTIASSDILPQKRLNKYKQSARNSKVLVKDLS
jgi:amino-acid N-acetyltransferase